jgi:hypothetical protein
MRITELLGVCINVPRHVRQLHCHHCGANHCSHSSAHCHADINIGANRANHCGAIDVANPTNSIVSDGTNGCSNRADRADHVSYSSAQYPIPDLCADGTNIWFSHGSVCSPFFRGADITDIVPNLARAHHTYRRANPGTDGGTSGGKPRSSANHNVCTNPHHQQFNVTNCEQRVIARLCTNHASGHALANVGTNRANFANLHADGSTSGSKPRSSAHPDNGTNSGHQRFNVTNCDQRDCTHLCPNHASSHGATNVGTICTNHTNQLTDGCACGSKPRSSANTDNATNSGHQRFDVTDCNQRNRTHLCPNLASSHGRANRTDARPSVHGPDGPNGTHHIVSNGSSRGIAADWFAHLLRTRHNDRARWFWGLDDVSSRHVRASHDGTDGRLADGAAHNGGAYNGGTNSRCTGQYEWPHCD